jgi:glycopeptide antibiotics resistance protein
VNKSALIKASGALYISIYLLAMVFPRKVPKDQLDPSNFLKKLFQDLLYLSGNLEFIGNTFLLVPMFLILIKLFGRLKDRYALIICLLLSAGAEFAQSFIPGRVSSLRDFILNSSGAVAVFFIHFLYVKKLSQQLNAE